MTWILIGIIVVLWILLGAVNFFATMMTLGMGLVEFIRTWQWCIICFVFAPLASAWFLWMILKDRRH
jgi:hypothetical protein